MANCDKFFNFYFYQMHGYAYLRIRAFFYSFFGVPEARKIFLFPLPYAA